PGAKYYVNPDHLGAPRSIVDGSGNTVWKWDRDPFGNGAPTGTLIYNLRFPGQYFDSETGLYYNMARDYSPSLGRYVQSDPIGLRGGVNTYAYVGNNPLSKVDPWGLRPLTDCEKNSLRPYTPYIDPVDLDNADIHDGTVPPYLPSDMKGITRGDDIYFRAGAYNPGTASGIALLGHELVHVGQYRLGMTAFSYLWSSIGGYSEENKYENPAYALEKIIRYDLINSDFGGCECP
ncbi:MAG: DUF4157 domain-containing protein, partial [Deltaproteobacteria bacterium]|nr:DUF4157 domain-containing protein [Deltaproteobacteria bacterium]